MKKDFKSRKKVTLSCDKYLKTKKSPYSLALYVMCRMVLAVIVFCCVSFVISINDLAVKGFALNNLKAEIIELEHLNKSFEIKAMKLESFDVIEEKALELEMVKVGEIDYVTMKSDLVAKK